MVSILPLISNSPSLFSKPSEKVPRELITIIIMYHSCFDLFLFFWGKGEFLSGKIQIIVYFSIFVFACLFFVVFCLFFSFLFVWGFFFVVFFFFWFFACLSGVFFCFAFFCSLWSTELAKFTHRQILYFLLIYTRSCLLPEIEGPVCLVARCWAFVVWAWVSASQRIPWFWRETHTKGLCTRSPTRLEEDERRKVPEENRRKHRPGQSTEQGSQQKSGEADSQEKKGDC